MSAWAEENDLRRRRGLSVLLLVVLVPLIAALRPDHPQVRPVAAATAGSLLALIWVGSWLRALPGRPARPRTVSAHAPAGQLRPFGLAPARADGRRAIVGTLGRQGDQWTWRPAGVRHDSRALTLRAPALRTYRKAWAPLLPHRGYVTFDLGDERELEFFVVQPRRLGLVADPTQRRSTLDHAGLGIALAWSGLAAAAVIAAWAVPVGWARVAAGLASGVLVLPLLSPPWWRRLHRPA